MPAAAPSSRGSDVDRDRRSGVGRRLVVVDLVTEGDDLLAGPASPETTTVRSAAEGADHEQSRANSKDAV